MLIEVSLLGKTPTTAFLGYPTHAGDSTPARPWRKRIDPGRQKLQGEGLVVFSAACTNSAIEVTSIFSITRAR